VRGRRFDGRSPLVAFSLLFFGAQLPVTPSLGLPSELAGYRLWPAATREPIPVPLKLWVLCSRPTAEQRAEAYKVDGVHTERYVNVYANPAAVAILPDQVHRTFPVGSVIAKEKLLDPSDKSPDGVAFMVRRGEPRFRDSGGWEFLYFPTDGHKAEVHQACAACHRSSPTGDYVLGSYPRQGSAAAEQPDAPGGAGRLERRR